MKRYIGFVIVCLAILLTLQSSSGAILNLTENSVDFEPDEDGSPNLGLQGSTTFSDTNNLDGVNQTIQEENNGAPTDNWAYLKNIVVNPNSVAGDLIDFPVYVELFDPDLKEKAQLDGDDIAFFDETDSQLAHEIELYDPAFNDTHARMIAWVNTDLYGSRETRISLKYGNSTMSSQQDPSGVWDSNYDNIWHLDNNPSLAAPQVDDSTLTNNGTSYGSMTTDDLSTGQLGYGLDFDGIDDLINVQDVNSDSWQGLTVSTWIYKRDTGDDFIFSVSDNTAAKDSIFALIARDDIFRGRVSTDGSGGGDSADYDTPAGAFVPNQWQYVTMTWNSSTDTFEIYVDGQIQLSTSRGGDTIRDDTVENPAGLNGTIGNVNLADSRYYNGMIDELRLSRYSKSSDWIATEFENQNNTSTFYTLGEELLLNTFDPVDTQSDVDNSQDHLGTHSNFYDMKFSDGLSDTLQEDGSQANSHSVGSSGAAYVRIGDGSVAWNSASGTISLWVKFNQLGGTQYSIWALNNLMELRTTSGDLILDWGETSSLSAENTVTTGIWYFVTVAWDEDLDTLELYLGQENTVPVLEANRTDWTVSVSGLTVDGNHLLASSSGQNNLRGEADELRYYDTARSLSEIQSDYNMSLFGNEPNLRSYYHLDNAYTDEGPDGNDAVGIFGPSFSTDIPSIDQKASFDQEAQWTNVPTQDTVSYLTILTGTLSSENLNVEYWDGSSWSVLFSGLSAESWNNISLEGILASNTFTIRFVDDTVSGDSVISSWEIDAVMIQLYNYRLDWEHQVQNIDTSQEYYNLTVYAASSDLEGFEIKIWNTSESMWTSSFATITEEKWYNISLTDTGLISPDITWQYLDTTTTGDGVPTTLDIDYAAITSYSIAPEFSSTPADLEYDEGTTTNSLSWTAIDDHPGTFTLFRNGSQIDMDNWSSGTAETFNVDGLERGVYNYTIVFEDQYGVQINDTAWVTVKDTTIPTTTSPSDLDINESSTGNVIEWTPSDLHPDLYTIFVNGSSVETDTWISDNPVSYNVDYLTKGTFNITIEFLDDSGNRVSDTVIVSVSDETPPEITNPPSDMEINETSTGNWLNWTITENYPETYATYQNGSVIDSGTWRTGVNYTLDELPLGGYNFTVIVYDSSGNMAMDTVMVTVVDATPPEIVSAGDFSYSEGSEGNEIVWTLSDNHPKNLTIYRNGTSILSTGWTSGDLSINIDGLSMGVYNYTIFAEDQSGNQAFDTVFVTVEDNTPPTVTSPPDVTYSYNDTGNSLNWTAEDVHPSTYTIERDGTEVDTGFWISGGTITISIDGLNVGTYNYTVIFTDTSGNQVTDEVTVTVVEESTFTSVPDDINYNPGDTNNELSWTMTDSDPDSYLIYNNSVIVAQGSWTSDNPVVINVDGLAIGEYNFTIEVNDTSGNTIVDTAWVTVSDIPVWDSTPSSEISYSEGIASYEISWNATDQFPDTFVVTQNGSTYTSGSWNNSDFITIDIGGFGLGGYNFTIVLNDTNGNTLTHTVILTVIDDEVPTGSQPEDVTYSEGTTAHNITWTPSDLHPDYYEIYQNNTYLNASEFWQSGEDIVFDIDGLTAGGYNFTIYVYDTSGNVWISTVDVTVTDDTDPTVSSPDDSTYAEADVSSNTIDWIALDLHPGTYEIYRNLSTLVESGSWNSGETISYSLSTLTKGVYNFTIYIYDSSGNVVTDLVWITVVDQTAPVVTSPPDATYSEGSDIKWVNWTATDSYNATYEIYLNGTLNETGNWISGVELSYEITTLTKGGYNITIIFYDESNNFAVDTVLITITDDTAPKIDTTTTNEPFVEGSSTKWINWTATDTYPDYYEIYVNNTLNITNSWISGEVISFDLTNFSKGNYYVNVYFFDTSSNEINQSLWVTISDETAPTVSNPPDITYAEDSTANTIVWSATDAHPDYYTVYQNNTNLIVDQTSWTSGSSISVNIDGLVKGSYNYTIYFYDEDGNVGSDTVNVVVTDETLPTVSQESDISYLEGDTGNSISWTVEDSYLSSYEVYNNSVLLQYGNWSGTTSDIISISVDGLLIGEYTFVIEVFDESGNVQTDTVVVSVIEITPPNFTDTPSDLSYGEGNTSVTISWTANDTYPADYEILVDGDVVDFGTWDNGVPVEFNISQLSLSKGVYSFNITITDTSGNENYHDFTVTVLDITPPTLESGEDLVYTVGESGNSIWWNASDKYEFSYEIYQNLSLIQSSVGTSDEPINLNVDDLDFGVTNFTIVVTDASGNAISGSIFVTVEDPYNPVLLYSSGDIQLAEVDVFGSLISWEFTDDFPLEYYITRNGNIVVPNSLWENDRNITLSLSELAKGSYNFTIYVWDEAGNVVTSSIIVTVTDATAPEFVDIPLTNITFNESSTGNSLSWTMTDKYEDRYLIYQNGVLVQNFTWTSNIEVVYDLDSLLSGSYNITMVIQDTSSNSAQFTTLVEVVDVTLPEFIDVPDRYQYFEGTVGNSLSWTVSDLHPGVFNITRDGTLVLDGIWSNGSAILLDIDGLSYGSYNFTITVADKTGNINTHSVIVDVIDNVKPELTLSPTNSTIEQYTTGNQLIYEAYDLHPNTYIFYLEGKILESKQWTNNNSIVINIDGFAEGYYNFTIEIFDDSQNKIDHYVLIRVKDPATVDTLEPELDVETDVYAGDVDLILGTWLTVDGEPVVDGEIRVILTSSNVEDIFTFTTSTNGSYQIVLNYTGFPPGTYTWTIEFIKEGYQSWGEYDFAVQVHPHTYLMEFDASDSLVQGEVYYIAVLVYYNNNNSANSSGMTLSAVENPNTGPAAGVEVTFIIQVYYEGGGLTGITKSVVTDANGLALISLSPSETSGLARFESISAKIAGGSSNFGTSTSLHLSEFPEIQPGEPPMIDRFIATLTRIFDILLYITGGLFLLGLIFVRRRQIIRSKIKSINESITNAQEEFKAIRSIKSIIIQTTNSVNVYTEEFEEDAVNSFLVGGMINAFSQFLDELASSELFQFEIMERGNVSVTSHKGKYSNFVAISTDPLPLLVLSQIQRAHMDLEADFESYFEQTTRGAVMLKPSHIYPYFEKHQFKISLHQKLKINEGNIRKIVNQKFISRLLKQNFLNLAEFKRSEYYSEDGFYLEDLLDYLSAQRVNQQVTSRIVILGYLYEIIKADEI